MQGDPFDCASMEQLYRDAFAPWIQLLGIKVDALTDEGARFVLPHNPELCREGGVVCGQAVAAVADTVGVLALAAKNGMPRRAGD